MKIGFILFPQVTQLDFTGPLQVLGRLPGAQCHIIAREMGPLKTDGPLTLLPTHDFGAAPQMDLICVPGGFGVKAAIEDAETRDFVRAQGEGASWVTSVCTGALLLGAAGLLTGKRATTHWAYTDLLSLFGAYYTPGRVVTDCNTITGGGVTAGIDFALTLIAALAGEATARSIQLALEYDPQPPFHAGTPGTADPETLSAARERYAAPVSATEAAICAALTSQRSSA